MLNYVAIGRLFALRTVATIGRLVSFGRLRAGITDRRKHRGIKKARDFSRAEMNFSILNQNLHNIPIARIMPKTDSNRIKTRD